MDAIKSSDPLKVSGVPRPGPKPGPGSDHQFFSNVEFENTSQISTLKTNRKIIEIDSNESKNSSISKSMNSNKSEFLTRVIQSKKLSQKINKSNTYQNPEKKRKTNQLNEILLFTSNQN